MVGAVVELRGCLDLTDTAGTRRLADGFDRLLRRFDVDESRLPRNRGTSLKARYRDCLAINFNAEHEASDTIRSVRGAFEEGEPVFHGASLRRQTHIQIAVRDISCVVGLFRPNPER